MIVVVVVQQSLNGKVVICNRWQVAVLLCPVNSVAARTKKKRHNFCSLISNKCVPGKKCRLHLIVIEESFLW